ncbi:MAG: hypothetical protein JO276_05205 [Sphingomonadaceae bacterium]|nr:hypothetical protein [Sphingomonadaceae bacterium]
MTEPVFASFELPRAAIRIVFLPLTVIVAGSLLIMLLGVPFHENGNLPAATGHLETAGRLKMLAAWLLLAATTVACLAYFVRTVRASAPGTRDRLTKAYIGLTLFGVAAVAGGLISGAPRFLGEHEICNAFAGNWEPGNLWPWLDLRPACSGVQFNMLWWLNEVQKIGLALVSPALVLGTISCLAMPDPGTRAACRLQARRLNAHLYLAAAVLVIGLLFLSALMRWPASGLAGEAAAPYTSHVDAYIFYWGATYSVFIASYYVPVAVWLSENCRKVAAPPAEVKSAAAGRKSAAAARDKGGESDADENPVSDLFSLFKTVAALFAPAIAGLLGSVLHL